MVDLTRMNDDPPQTNTAIANAMNQSIHTTDPRQRYSSSSASSSTAHPAATKTQSHHHYNSVILDPEVLRDNPIEAKHRRLVRSHRNGPLDRDLKPNPKIRDELNVSLYLFCSLVFLSIEPTSFSM